MKCLECLGACCEEITVTASYVDFPKAARECPARQEEVSSNVYALDCRCPKLTVGGRCSVYDDRPIVCAVMPAGGPDCLGAVRRRRTPSSTP